MMVPALRAVGDVAKMAGYPAGLLWRRREGRGAVAVSSAGVSQEE
jgi:hypothetical protein